MGKTTNPHWTKPLAPEKFAGKGYVPQALTHGTLENDDLAASERFYKEALGLEVVKLWPSSCYVKHPDTPWYIVCIQAQNPNRPRLSRYQRFTIALHSTKAVHDAHREFTANVRGWTIACDPGGMQMGLFHRVDAVNSTRTTGGLTVAP